jgi:hypothetical protein
MRTDFLGVGKIPGVGWENELGSIIERLANSCNHLCTITAILLIITPLQVRVERVITGIQYAARERRHMKKLDVQIT